MSDLEQQLQQTLRQALEKRQPLWIRGGGSHRDPSPAANASPIELSGHSGILDYHPEELVITVRSGTPLTEIQATLDQHQQRLAFDPPVLGANATIGGAVATGLAGPSRPWSGSVRDHLLGVRLLTGTGKILNLGGEVVKNVAGYDLFRPMAGAYGTLGILLELSLKTLPKEPSEITWSLPCKQPQALEKMALLNRQDLPLSGLSWADQQLHLRLAGPEEELELFGTTLKSEGWSSTLASPFWAQLRDQQHTLFQSNAPIWRLSLPVNTAALPFEKRPENSPLLDWGGRQRWISGTFPAEALRQDTAALGGNATLYRNGDATISRFHPLPAPLMQLQQQLKQLMDPANILNPGLLYPEI